MSGPHRKVPSARLSRLAAFGQMAGGVAGGVLAEGARRLARGERPQLPDLLLTPGNVGRVTEQRSRLRGAAMKLGQRMAPQCWISCWRRLREGLFMLSRIDKWAARILRLVRRSIRRACFLQACQPRGSELRRH